MLTEEDLHRYVAALQRNGFFGPDSWYMNAERNIAFAKEAANGGRIDLPVLFLHGAYDWVCQTTTSRLAEPMRAACAEPHRGHHQHRPLDGAGEPGLRQRRRRPLAGDAAAAGLAGGADAGVEAIDTSTNERRGRTR